MRRHAPRVTDESVDRYVHACSTLLQSSADIRIATLEEFHVHSDPCLHPRAGTPAPNLDTFAYSAARLPACMPSVRRLVLGQSHEQFEAAGLPMLTWEAVSASARRRALHYDGRDTLAVLLASASDIDDLVPTLVAYQIEWNKLHAAGAEQFREAVGPGSEATLAEIARRPSDLRVRLLGSCYSSYQAASQRWWGGIERAYLRQEKPRRRPVYFVSSNTHALANLLSGCSPDRDHRRHAEPNPAITRVERPGKVAVDAQLIDLAKLDPDRFDDRLAGVEVGHLRSSQALILNVDYPLGMAAYHHLSRVGQGVGAMRGAYVMGKAATLNGGVGDVIVPSVVHDLHSANTYLVRNAITASQLEPLLAPDEVVLDNQSSLTVRSAFLQNEAYLRDWHRQGYSLVEMEAGPYLTALYEMAAPSRSPSDELVDVAPPFDVGLVYYASDTPCAHTPHLLSRPLAGRGLNATYACAAAILSRIFEQESNWVPDDRERLYETAIG